VPVELGTFDTPDNPILGFMRAAPAIVRPDAPFSACSCAESAFARARRAMTRWVGSGKMRSWHCCLHGSLIAYRFACGGLATFVDCRAATFTFATTITCEASSGTVA